MYFALGHRLGRKFEEDFTEKAKARGLSDEETKSAFNRNMLDSGVLTDGPAQFGRTYNHRWLVTGYEAGDVVLHNTYMVGLRFVWSPSLLPCADRPVRCLCRSTPLRSTTILTTSSAWQPISDLSTHLGPGMRYDVPSSYLRPHLLMFAH